jgi:ribosomal protein S18 acetylase RimI-like enzyme
MPERAPKGQSEVRIRLAGPEDMESVRTIFAEYASEIGIDLSFQGFDDELRSLPGKYQAPEGCIVLAFVDGTIAGCAALRPLEGDRCEMKRLFVRDFAKGRGAGKALANKVLDEARGRGYRFIRLDTLPSMAKAQGIYKSLGFYEIGPYVYNPIAGSVFMEKKLR